MNILISACLLGVKCRYDAEHNYEECVAELIKHHNLIPVCPEQLGGMTTPRDPSERVGERVLSKSGTDVTKSFERGALEALRLAKLYQCTCAVLKERSPSCGNGLIYDGNFTGNLIPGDGVTAELFKRNGIQVFGETDACRSLGYNRS